MYPDQIKIVKGFVEKFETNANQIMTFVRNNRLLDGGVEKKPCYTGVHSLNIGQTVYVFNGESMGIKSVFCSDLKCFLEGVDKIAVKKFIEGKKK